MVDENAPHQLGSNPIELSAALPMGRMLSNQLEIGFMNQSSGLKGMARPLAPHIPAGQPFELVIDQRNKLFLSGLVPIRYFDQQGRHVWFRDQVATLQPYPVQKTAVTATLMVRILPAIHDLCISSFPGDPFFLQMSRSYIKPDLQAIISLRSRRIFMRNKTLATYTRFAALLTAVAAACMGTGYAGGWQHDQEQLAQMAELHNLHATFHAAVSVHDPVNGDSAAEITQRIKDALSVFAEDAVLNVVGSTATAGNYVGNGDPDDASTCPKPTGDTSAGGKQGTLCTFFKYVAGGLQQANRFVSLSPEYKTKFVPVYEDGQWTSSVYFECHYFDVSLNPATGLPFWTAKSHVDLDGVAKKINGKWLLTQVSSSAVGIPIP